MSDADLIPDLRLLPHFRGLPPDLMGAVAAGSKRVPCEAGQVIFSEGEPVPAFYCV